MNKKIIFLAAALLAAVLIFNFAGHKPKIPDTSPKPPDFSKLPEVPDSFRQKAMADLARVKVMSQYRYVTDGQAINRSPDNVINIFKETHTDFIFQGWLTQQPLPEKCSDLAASDKKKCETSGYSYEILSSAVSKIHVELPGTIFNGGTQFEFFYPGEISGGSDKEQRDKAWKMTLSPAKWGLSVTRKDMQCYWAKRWAFLKSSASCPNEEDLKSSMKYYFPDVTDPDFQKLFLKRIFRQIDAGVDAVWIDMLYVQPALLGQLSKNDNHPAVRESYAAIWDIVDKIHKYGYSKGKYIYVVTWVAQKEPGSIIMIPKTNVDAAMLSFLPNEVKNPATGKIGQFDEKLWDDAIGQIREKLGLPIFARIDYGGGRTPLGVFSQELNRSESGEFLKKADEFLTKKGVTFIYPIHGGDMAPYGGNALKLSYGNFNWYDSLAPEFDTYGIIKELANKKK